MADISKIDMERINGLLDKLDEVTNKLDSMKYIIETSFNSNGWYRKWSDGWIEQGGIINISQTHQIQNQTTTFMIPFQTKVYYINGDTFSSNNTNISAFGVLSKTLNNFKWSLLYLYARDSQTTQITWYACGY